MGLAAKPLRPFPSPLARGRWTRRAATGPDGAPPPHEWGGVEALGSRDPPPPRAAAQHPNGRRSLVLLVPPPHRLPAALVFVQVGVGGLVNSLPVVAARPSCD